MGIGAPLLDMHISWADDGLLKSGSTVLDLGAQELFAESDPPALNRFLTRFGANSLEGKIAERMAARGLVGDLFTSAGFRYRSVDIYDAPYVIRMDLNTDTLPREHHGRYAWVTNHGTSEHILNQWNVFKTMHDACAVGGVMYHNVPMVDSLHGIFAYSPKFFRTLIEANSYEVIRMWAWHSGEPAPLDEALSSDVKYEMPTPVAECVWFNAMLRRTNDRPFAGLSDCIPDQSGVTLAPVSEDARPSAHRSLIPAGFRLPWPFRRS